MKQIIFKNIVNFGKFKSIGKSYKKKKSTNSIQSNRSLYIYIYLQDSKPNQIFWLKMFCQILTSQHKERRSLQIIKLKKNKSKKKLKKTFYFIGTKY